jgi:hypothetical protein
MMANSVIPLPKDPIVAQKVIEADAAKHARDMGRIGYWFGSRENAVVYLAAAVIVIAMCVSGILAYQEPTLRADTGKALLALALSALGFMFGAGGRHRDH